MPQPSPEEQLLKAVSNGDVEKVRTLLNEGADPDVRSKNGEPALHRASGFDKKVEIVSLLLSAGADIETRDKDGGTALMRAVASSNREVALFLIQKGADTAASAGNGETLLHKAGAVANKEILRFVIDKASIPLDTTDDKGNTPMHHAAGLGYIESVKTLLEKGAAADLRNNVGATPLIAMAGYVSHSYNMASFCPEMQEYFTLAVQEMSAIAPLLLKAGADIDACDNQGVSVKSALDEAGCGDLFETLQVLDRQYRLEREEQRRIDERNRQHGLSDNRQRALKGLKKPGFRP